MLSEDWFHARGEAAGLGFFVIRLAPDRCAEDVNDTYGHQTGDHVLIEITRRLSENLRSSDVLVRCGGEEFVIVMRHCTIDDARPLAERIRALVADTPLAEVGRVTVSIGAAPLAPEVEAWMDRADRAM